MPKLRLNFQVLWVNKICYCLSVWIEFSSMCSKSLSHWQRGWERKGVTRLILSISLNRLSVYPFEILTLKDISPCLTVDLDQYHLVELPAMMKIFCFMLPNIIAIRYMWLLSIWNVVSKTEKVNLKLHLI